MASHIGDPIVQKVFNALPDANQIPQRQDSSYDQLRDLYVIANRMKMYDAADRIRRDLLKWKD